MKLLISLFITLTISVSHAGFSEGLDAMQKGDYKTSIFNFKQALEEEDMESFKPMLTRYLAMAYYYAPEGIDDDYKLAFKHYLAASEKFDSGVMLRLGDMHYVGRGVKQDYVQARQYLEKSIKYKESISALWLLGKIHLHGYGIEQDFDIAKDYFERADAIDSANSQFELGHMYEYGKGTSINIPRALAYYEKAIQKGDTDAQYKADVLSGKIASQDRNVDFEKALDYTYGFTVQVDFDKAIEYYQKSADKGDATSLYNIGFVIGLTSPTKQEKLETEYYKRAAELGNIYAQTALSDRYYLGLGVDIDKAKSLYWDTQAALQGNVNSMKDIALQHYLGKGTSKNYHEAIYWYQKAVDQGDKESLFDLAEMHKNGEGFDKNTDKAVELFIKAAELGYAEAQDKLAKYYLRAIYVKRDYKKSLYWANKAADQGVAQAYNTLAYLYITGKDVVEINAEKAFEYYNKAADLGNVKAITNLAKHYLAGLGVKKDKPKAFKLFKKAADLGNAASQHQMGIFYEFGIVVQKDLKKAKEWYVKAINQNYKKSQMALASMYYYGDKDTNAKKNYKKAAEWYRTAAKNDKENEEDKLIDVKISSSGSGFFVTPNHIVTNNHVTEDCDELEVKNKGYKATVELLDTDSTTDLSILVTGKPNNSFLYLRNRKPVVTGEQSIALGYPFSSTLGSELKVTSGNIAALTGFNNNIAEFQLTSPVQPGNSGGPLLDDNGNVIGVIVSRLETSAEITGSRPAQNVNFAIKSNMAKIFMDLNMVDYQVRKSNGTKEISQIVTEAKEATVQVICKEKE